MTSPAPAKPAAAHRSLPVVNIIYALHIGPDKVFNGAAEANADNACGVDGEAAGRFIDNDRATMLAGVKFHIQFPVSAGFSQLVKDREEPHVLRKVTGEFDIHHLPVSNRFPFRHADLMIGMYDVAL